MPNLTLLGVVVAILCTLAWKKYREKQGKKASLLTEILVAGVLAFALSFMIGFVGDFVPAFVHAFTRSFIENYARSRGGAVPSMTTVYLVLGGIISILVVMLAVFLLGVRYAWKTLKRQSNARVAGVTHQL